MLSCNIYTDEICVSFQSGRFDKSKANFISSPVSSRVIARIVPVARNGVWAIMRNEKQKVEGISRRSNDIPLWKPG